MRQSVGGSAPREVFRWPFSLMSGPFHLWMALRKEPHGASMEAIYRWTFFPYIKVQETALRLCAIPPGRVAPQPTPELACQYYMRVTLREFSRPGKLPAPLGLRRREAGFGAARR